MLELSKGAFRRSGIGIGIVTALIVAATLAGCLAAASNDGESASIEASVSETTGTRVDVTASGGEASEEDGEPEADQRTGSKSESASEEVSSSEATSSFEGSEGGGDANAASVGGESSSSVFDANPKAPMDYSSAKSLGADLMMKKEDSFDYVDACQIDRTITDYTGMFGGAPAMALRDSERTAIPVVDISHGAQLVLLRDCYYGFWRATDNGEYILPDEIGNGYGFDSGYKGFETLDGVPLTEDGPEDEEILASKGARYLLYEEDGEGTGYILGKKGTTFVAGCYVGADFVETEFEISTRVYDYEEKKMVPDKTRSDDGYFILDASSFKPGLYLGYYGDGFKVVPQFLFQVK